MTPKWQKLASLAQEICTLWFQFFGAVFASNRYTFKNIFDVEKNNLVIGENGVFGLVSYHNNNIEVGFLRLYKFVFECGDRRRGFCFFR